MNIDKLYVQTTFAKTKKHPAWGGLSIKNDHIFVPECSYFGETMINLADSYEQSGADCLFIQELVKLYRQGKLK